MNLQMFLLEEGKVKESAVKYYFKWIDLYKQHRCETGRFYNSTIQKAFHEALLFSDIPKKASVHTLRHSFATHLIEAGYDI